MLFLKRHLWWGTRKGSTDPMKVSIPAKAGIQKYKLDAGSRPA